MTSRLTAFLLLLCLPRVQAQVAAMPDLPSGRALGRFVAAFNTGDFDELNRFIRDNPGFRTTGAGRFVQLFREYGPVDVVWIESSDSLRISAWARGRQTKAPVGLLLQVQRAAPERIDWLGIDRRSLPPEAIRKPSIVDEDELSREIDRWVEDNRDGVFSGVIAVGRGDRVVASRAFGRRDPGGAAITGDDAFLLASVSKVFVGLAAARLVEQGRLRWDDPIDRYLPEFPRERIRGITVGHLLEHRSGLEFDDDSLFNRAIDTASSLSGLIRLQAEALGRIRADSVIGPLGRFDYSNEGFVAAARVVEVIAGVPYYQFLEAAVLGPFGMGGTGPFDPASPPVPFARPWTGRRRSDGATMPGPLRLAIRSGFATPSGGMVSTGKDLLALGAAVVGRRFLTNEGWRAVLGQAGSTPNPDYGYGFELEYDASGTLVAIGHSGNSFGVSAEFLVLPGTSYVIVVLANREGVAKAVASYFNELVPR